jgi:hypothetical protein
MHFTHNQQKYINNKYVYKNGQKKYQKDEMKLLCIREKIKLLVRFYNISINKCVYIATNECTHVVLIKNLFKQQPFFLL